MRSEVELKHISATRWSLASIAFGPLVFAVIHTSLAILRRSGYPLSILWAIPLARLYFALSLASMICALVAIDKDSESGVTKAALFLSILNVVVAVGEAG